MKKRILIILLLSSFCSFGQTDSEFKSQTIVLDSIKIEISVYQNRIETESYFEKSKSKLSITYLKKNNDFNKVKTRENCPSMPEDFWRSYVFDFENGKVVNEEEDGAYYSSARMHGIAGRLDREVKETYNKTLSSEFLKEFVVELFEKIKNYR